MGKDILPTNKQVENFDFDRDFDKALAKMERRKSNGFVHISVLLKDWAERKLR